MMKVRSGFVSNSSSSSFIVGFDEEPPRDVDEMAKVLFPSWPDELTVQYCGRKASISQLAQLVVEQLDAKHNPVNPDDAIGCILMGTFPGDPSLETFYHSNHPAVVTVDESYRRKYGEDASHMDYDDWKQERHDAVQQASQDLHRDRHAAANELWERMAPQFDGKVLYRFSFGNYQKFGEVAEMGDIFRNLPSIRSSQH